MKTVYYKLGDAEWKFEIDDGEYARIVESITADAAQGSMLDECLDILRQVSALEELSEDDEIDQTIATAYLWYHFNVEHQIGGDPAIMVDEDGDGLTVVAL
jgi:hypothetical protein